MKRTKADSHNDNYNAEEPIELCFDFSEDLAELEEPVEYAELSTTGASDSFS